MKGKFKPTFSKEEIERFMRGKLERVQEALISMLKRTGEDFVTNARNLGSYKDQTGNLRSSTGYIIIKDGLQLTKGGFVKIKANKSIGKKLATIIDGPKAGEALADEIHRKEADKFKKGLFLIAVAGMQYAVHVEAKGYDVITGSSLMAEKQLKESVERIRTKAFKGA